MSNKYLEKIASAIGAVEEVANAVKRTPLRLTQPIHPEHFVGPKAPDLIDKAHRLVSNISNRAAKHGITKTHLGMAGMGVGGLAVGRSMSGGNNNQ